MQRRVPALDKARRLIGFEPTISLSETIQQVAAYMRASPGNV
jgi:hypothetical protein